MKKIFSLLAAVLFAGSMMAGQFARVSDMANLAPGDQIILVSESEDYALGTTQNTNNRAAVAVTVANDVIEAGENVQVITLEASGQNLKLKVGEDAYLYAASSSSNYLKTADAATAGDNAVWAISSSGDTVTLIAQGTNTRNILHFNPNNGNPIFSCYGPTSSVTALVKIFKAEGGETPALGAWNQVVFTAAAAADAIPEDSIFASDKAGFQAQISDSGNKMAIDANACRFGTAQGYEMYNFRLKSGGASGSDKNFITISVPTAGKLGLAVRTGSNSATDRVLYVLQDGDTLYNGIIQESMAVETLEDTVTVKVYPYVTVDAKAGNVIVRYSAGLNFYAFGFNASLAPEAPDTIPTAAPAAPKQAEADVMGIYCNHYTTNNANFAISGWAGAYQVLDLNGTNVGYWKDMTWECIIDPAHTDSAHNFSSFANLHVDMWAPAAAKIKFTAEAVAGGNYKDGKVVELAKGWNSFDFALAEWTGNYDFSNLKCFVFEQYQTPAGESFEHNPFAFANIYFWNAPTLVDPTNCAEAAAAALSVSANNELYNNGKVYTIEGYVTEIQTAFSEQYKNITFWMADTKDGGKVLEAYRAVCDTITAAPIVGDKVKVTGSLTKYNTTPEFAAGCTFVILNKPAADTVVIGEITYGEVYTEYFAEFGAVDVVFTTQPVVGDALAGDGYLFYLDIYPEDANDITGVYSVDSMTLDLEYSGVDQIVGTDTTSIELVDGTVVFQVLEADVEQNLAQLAIVGELEAEDGTVFIISAATVVYYEFIDEEGIEEVMAENEGKTIKFVQDGQIYILRDNKVYGLRGERVR